MPRALFLSLICLTLSACGGPDPDTTDAGADRDAASAIDAGRDGGVHPDASIPRDATTGDAETPSDAAIALDAGLDDGGAGDAGAPDAGALDAGHDAGTDPVFDVRVLADSACADLSFDPASIAVPAGTSFTIHWINATGCTEIDIDMGGTVPIVIGLPPGASHHDTVREWCGSYTGTYVFRAYYSPSFPYYLDVDCSA